MDAVKKLSKAAAGYLTAAQVGGADLGTRCGKCRDYIALSGECVIVAPPQVSGARGTCTQYIFGQPVSAGVPRLLIAKDSVGYIEGRDVPTYCGRCEYYAGAQYEDFCSKVGDSDEDKVEYGGCCNSYEAS